MKKTVVVTARIDEETLAGLDRLAEHYERSRAWLVGKAVARYVNEESEFFAFVQEEMEAWVKSLRPAADAA